MNINKKSTFLPCTISTWLKHPPQTVLPGLVMIQFKHSEQPWREVEDPYLELMKTFKGRPVIKVVHENSGDEFIYLSAVEGAKAHGLTVTTFNERLNSCGKRVYRDGYRYGRYPW